MAMTDGTPQNYKEAMHSSESGMWKKAMDSEYQKLLSENVYELCDVPATVKNVMKNRWVFKKIDFHGNVTEYKARLVAKGFTQKYGDDYQETFDPVAKLKSIRALTAFCASQCLAMLQDDVPCDFLKAIYQSGVYLRGSPTLKLNYSRDSELKLEGFMDASYANHFKYASTSGYINFS
jgi:hypothetical protein